MIFFWIIYLKCSDISEAELICCEAEQLILEEALKVKDDYMNILDAMESFAENIDPYEVEKFRNYHEDGFYFIANLDGINIDYPFPQKKSGDYSNIEKRAIKDIMTMMVLRNMCIKLNQFKPAAPEKCKILYDLKKTVLI